MTQDQEPANNVEQGPPGSPAAAPAAGSAAGPAAAPAGTPPEVTHNPERDPSDWVTGDEPSTGPQESYIRTLAKEAGEEVPTGLTKAQASETIDRLQDQTGRG
jgi:hypothetical protein